MASFPIRFLRDRSAGAVIVTALALAGSAHAAAPAAAKPGPAALVADKSAPAAPAAAAAGKSGPAASAATKPASSAADVPAGPFSLEHVAQRARTLAASPYQAPAVQLAQPLRELDYDAARDIRFKPDHALWRKDRLPFEVMFFPTNRGMLHPVRIHVVGTDGKVEPLEFDPADYDYGRNKFTDAQLKTQGYAGFRLHFPVNKPGYKDEVAVFLGASYFRAIGKDAAYGASARGLAIDTGAAGGEEFPRFSVFWIEKPRSGAKAMTIYALLDSPRVTGAYRFVVTPGNETVTQVQARLYGRAGIDKAKAGYAPLTSMFHFGENQPAIDDFRPEVHDSDGLSIHTAANEWIWRPLINPQRLLITSFAFDAPPVGFGLMQRDRNYANYEDPEALYEKRPSAWVEPQTGFGAGRVELVQIPTPDETNDNIVAYWVPNAPLQPGKAHDVSWLLRWQGAGTSVPADRGLVVQSRHGRDLNRGNPGDMQYVVDFDGPTLRALPEGAKPEAVVDVGRNGQLLAKNLYRNRVNGTWRMTMRLRRQDAAQPIEVRAYMKSAGAASSSSSASPRAASRRAPAAKAAPTMPEGALSEVWSAVIPAQEK